MPDPKDPTPVSVVERGGKFVIVTADGKPLADGDEYVDYAKAETDASTINGSWKNAAAERKAKGMTEARIAETLGLTEPLEEAFGQQSFVPFNPALHPHGGRGQFAATLHQAAKEGSGVELPSGVRVHREGTLRKHYVVSHPDAPTRTVHSPEEAVSHALQTHRLHVRAAAEVERHAAAMRRQDTLVAHGGPRSRVAAPGRGEARAPGRRMEESAVAAVLHGGPQVHLHFDPRLHRRDRAGKFAETLGKLSSHGSTVELPHGVKVENHLGKLRVHSPYGVSRFSSPEAAAAVAIAGVDHGEVAHGADPNVLYAHHMSELEGARRAAMAKSAVGDLRHVEAVQQALRQRRGTAPHIESHRGRTAATRTAYAETHAPRDAHGMLDRARTDAARLPAASEEADAVRPAQDAEKLRVVTGYGEYAAVPNPGAPNIYDLHRDGQRLAVIGTRHAAHGTLTAIHDEAMQRHVAAKADAREQVVRDILKLKVAV